MLAMLLFIRPLSFGAGRRELGYLTPRNPSSDYLSAPIEFCMGRSCTLPTRVQRSSRLSSWLQTGFYQQTIWSAGIAACKLVSKANTKSGNLAVGSEKNLAFRTATFAYAKVLSGSEELRYLVNSPKGDSEFKSHTLRYYGG